MGFDLYKAGIFAAQELDFISLDILLQMSLQ